MAEALTLGVEEEFHLVDPSSGRLSASSSRLVRDSAEATEPPGLIGPEMLASQIELATPVCSDLGELRSALTHLRAELAATAHQQDLQLVANGTYPGPHRPPVTPGARYEDMAARYGVVAREQVVCGCHVHVGVADPELAVAVMNRSRPWLAVLLALSANSPFWRGTDTDYASYRSQIWCQWPSAGPPGVFDSYADYVASTQRLVDVGVLRDRGMLYWDIRPSEHVSTVEFRICDVSPEVDQEVMLAGLARALTVRCIADEEDRKPLPNPTPELLSAARWRAARSGLSDGLVEPVNADASPAADQVQRLIDYVEPVLSAHGDREIVLDRIDRLMRSGTGATRQRRAFRRRHSLRDVLAATTVTGHER